MTRNIFIYTLLFCCGDQEQQIDQERNEGRGHFERDIDCLLSKKSACLPILLKIYNRLLFVIIIIINKSLQTVKHRERTETDK